MPKATWKGVVIVASDKYETVAGNVNGHVSFWRGVEIV